MKNCSFNHLRKLGSVDSSGVGLPRNRVHARLQPILAVTGILILATIWGSAAQAQQASSEPSQSPPPEAPKAIAAADIASESINTRALIRAARAELGNRQDVAKVKAEFEAYRPIFTDLRTQTRQRLSRNEAAPVIEAGRREWIHVQGRLDRWLSSLTSVVNVIDYYLELISEEKSRWYRTREEKSDGLPTELIQSVRDTVSAIEKAESQLKLQRSDLLGLQTRIGQEKAETIQILEDQKREIAERRRDALSIDSPPLWRAWSESTDSATDQTDGPGAWRIGTHSLEEFLQQIAPRLAGQVVIFIVLVMLLFALRHKIRQYNIADRLKTGSYLPFEHPFAVALAICSAAIIILFPGAPPLWNSVMVTVLVIATLRLVHCLIRPSALVSVYLIGGVIVTWQVLQALNVSPLTYRLAMMLIAGLGLAGTMMIARSNRAERSDAEPGIGTGRKAYTLASVFFIIALLAILIGSLSLASILIGGTLLAILSATLVSLAVVLLEALLDFLIQSRFAGHLGIIRNSPESVRRALSRIIRTLGWAIWIYVVLRGFLIFDPVFAAASRSLEANIAVGNIALSLADLLLFAAVVWITFKFSRFLQAILAADVLPRMHLPRGVPDAVMSLSHYVIIVLGFLFALAAAGFDLSRITILVGALGVGIGFGLQNVVNNFVSGLILLFERPIKQGDVVEIDGTAAVVKHIAMRASIVRDYDGANIIVPNSDLISAKVVNWTYRSDLRRIKIAVGVKYGSDPREVIELLNRVASENPGVSSRPAPEALFMDFGESSLNFLLRVWTSVDSFLQVGSDLRVEITEAFKAANIEIPFPQRDIHLVTTAHEPKTISHEVE